ncbi:MAG: undecaprenyl-phosphate glucose phosphotransferase [Oligoflexia bacterium]|nr:undecaprenyl-phosphate glucose phosphotransferase [Oligoflexia bacterium]
MVNTNLVKIFTDIVNVTIAWFLTYYIRFNFIPNAQPGLLNQFIGLYFLILILNLYFFNRFRLYNNNWNVSTYSEIIKSLKANSFSFMFFIFILYFVKYEKISRLHLTIYFLSSSILILIFKSLLIKYLKKQSQEGASIYKVVIVGDGDNLIQYVKTVQSLKKDGIEIIGWYDSNGMASQYNITPVNSEVDIIENFPEAASVIVSYSSTNTNKASDFFKRNYDKNIIIQTLPDISYSLVGHAVEEFRGIPILTLNKPKISYLDLFIKRLFDLSCSVIALTILFPFLLVIAILIKITSKGPIFYSQERVTVNDRIFKMWKFRSMTVAQANEDVTTWSSKNSSRVTPIGAFIRKTSIDELPQLWNVVIGDMSLIGPRPERPFFVDKFKSEIKNYGLRHKMKAGISGWAQVNGWRGDTDLSQRIACDIYYIKHWSLWLDVKIIILTFIKGFINKNAY